MAAASFKPYPYSPQDYLPVCLGMVLYSEADHTPAAQIILNRLDEHGDKKDTEHALVLSISGDASRAISTVILPPDKVPHTRPVALDLLWKVR